MRLIVVLIVIAVPQAASGQVLFDFHSAFWMNLHHYLQALGRDNGPLVEALPESASATERAQWERAVEFYRTRYGKRALVFDEMLVGIKQQLIAAESGESLAAVTLAPEHRQVLERVAPIYRRHWWSHHDARNRAFIVALQTLLERHGRVIAARLASSYNSTWPVDGLRVDVVRDAGPPGNAYTTNVPRPTHITIGAAEHGLAGLELIFHEASHHWDQQLMTAVADGARALGRRPPPDLWHALLFFNAGEITRRALAAAGIRDYEMLMFSGKIFARPGWHAAIARHWPGFLDGSTSRAAAVESILAEVGAKN